MRPRPRRGPRPAPGLLPSALVLLVALSGCVGPPAGNGSEQPEAAAPEALSWQRHPDAPFAATEVAVGHLDDAPGGGFVVVGGLPPSLVGSRAAWYYEPATETWNPLPDHPLPIHHTAVVAGARALGLGVIACTFGGYHAVPFVATAQTFCLDDDDEPWFPLPPLPEPRGAHAAVRVGDDVVLVGGNDLTGQPAANVLIYNGTRDEWRTGAPIPTPREHLAATVHEGIVYAVAGRQNSFATNLATLEAYDPAADTWTVLADAPTARGGVTAATYRDHVVLIGGEGNGGTFAQVEAYNVTSGTWETWPDLPTPRHGLGSGVHGDRLFVLLGGPEPGLTESAVVESLGAG